MKTIICPDCENEIDSSLKVCPKCGCPLSSSVKKYNSNEFFLVKYFKKYKKIFLLVGSVLSIILLITALSQTYDNKLLYFFRYSLFPLFFILNCLYEYKLIKVDKKIIDCSILILPFNYFIEFILSLNSLFNDYIYDYTSIIISLLISLAITAAILVFALDYINNKLINKYNFANYILKHKKLIVSVLFWLGIVASSTLSILFNFIDSYYPLPFSYVLSEIAAALISLMLLIYVSYRKEIE